MYYDYYTKIVDSILGDSDGTYISNHISSTSSDDLLSMMLEKILRKLLKMMIVQSLNL